jgi:hypothetical protein
MKSDILVSLIKEVVKNEVKSQVKEELAKLIKSGAVTLNSKKQSSTPTLKDLTEVKTQHAVRPQSVVQRQPVKQIVKDPLLNEILNSTIPFTSAERVEGGMAGGSVLDALQPSVSMEGDWETMDYRDMNIPNQQIPTTDNAELNALTKALTRDYTELVKRFK